MPTPHDFAPELQKAHPVHAGATSLRSRTLKPHPAAGCDDVGAATESAVQAVIRAVPFAAATLTLFGLTV